MKTGSRVRKYVNIFIVIASVASWLALLVFGEGELAERGINSLKYFTVLSNLFAGLSSVIWLISSRENGKASETVERLKYIAAASVALTFTVVMVFLGPLYGYPEMFNKA